LTNSTNKSVPTAVKVIADANNIFNTNRGNTKATATVIVLAAVMITPVGDTGKAELALQCTGLLHGQNKTAMAT